VRNPNHMKVVIQRCLSAQVTIDHSVVAQINHGLVILIGVGKEDNHTDAEYLIQKIIQMRIFSDEEGKMNRSVTDLLGDVVLVSQFTLFADTKKGNRPSFIHSAPPDQAKALYDYFVETFKKQFTGKIETGVFGADMKVSLVNDGPVTIIMDTANK
jgi:D-tyrosyl-tRNA(Tyr) deacylase